jgi:heavy metal efflux system protein
MIARIVSFSLSNRALIFALTLVLVGFGARGYLHLTVDAVPDVTSVQVQVLTTAQGLSPLEIESMVTRPVEVAMSGLPGATTIRSVSRTAISAVTVVFDEHVDLGRARELVAQRLAAAREAVPPSAGRPQMGPMSTGLGEVYHFTLHWPGHSPMELRTLLNWEIAYPLRTVPGVVEVNGWGGDERQIEVRLRQSDLAALRVTPMEVERVLLDSGQNTGGGALERGEEQILVRLDAQYRTLADVRNQVIRSDRGTPVRVSDIATVQFGAAPRVAAATADGDGPTQYVMVQMIAGGNASEVVARVKSRLSEIQQRLPPGVELKPFYDRAEFVTRVLSTVWKSLAEGGLVVALVLLLFLGDLRAGLLVATVIPLSMLGAFGLMQAFGLSGNLMSLGAIDFGLVVDGAVVIVEGALASMAAHNISGKVALARDAQKYGSSIAFGVFIIGIVYVPVLMLQGVEGAMFRPMALTVLFALGCALVLTFTWVPALGSLILNRAHASDPWIVRGIRRVYTPLNHYLTLHPGPAIALAATLLVFGVLAGRTLGADFVPRLEEGDLVLQLTRPPSVSVAESELGTTTIERALKQFPEVTRVVSRSGSPDVATDVMGLEQSDVFVGLRPRAEWTTAKDREALIAQFDKVLKAALPGTAIGFTQPIEMRVQELLGGVKSDVGIKVFGEDLNTLQTIAGDVARKTNAVFGASDVRIEPTEGLPVISLRPDLARLARLGMNGTVLRDTTELLREGRTVGTLAEGERRFPIQMRFDQALPADLDSLGNLRLPLGDDKTVLLPDVSNLVVDDVPAQLSREQGRRRIAIEANVRGRDLAGFVNELKRSLAQLALPPGYSVELSGQYENLVRAAERLSLVVPVTLAAILVLLYLAFGAARPALLILLNVPVATSGGVIALALRDLPFSVSAAIGFIALFGVATMNGVVLLSAIREHAAAGATPLESARKGAQERLRPVVTTAVVASLGFLPMAIAQGVGAEVQRPLATVVMGGLVTATLLTLLVLPALSLRRGDRRANPAPQ